MTHRPLFYLLFLILLFKQCYLQQANTTLDPTLTFDEYIVKFNKNYNSSEYEFRKQVFQKNYQQILELDGQSDGKFHYEANKFTDWTEEEKQKLNGFHIYSDTDSDEESALSDPLPEAYALSSVQVPTSLNYLAMGMVSQPKDQQECGGCWAFSSTGQLQSLIKIFKNKMYDLSVQYTLECSGGGTCQAGGRPFEALKSIIPNGVPQEAQYPYKGGYNGYSTSDICSQDDKIYLGEKLIKVGHYSGLTDYQVQLLLYLFGPLSIGIYSKPLYSYGGGVFTGCPSDSYRRLNHAVLLVGYTSSGDWIIKNSWGTEWGQNGYFRLSKNSNCGLNAWVDTVQLQTFVSKVLEPTSVPSDNSIEYGINMTDTYGDGWNNNELSLEQNGKTFTFGSQFTTGKSFQTIYVTLQINSEVRVVATTVKRYTEQVGFVIFQKGTNKVVVNYAPNKFQVGDILAKWCPGTQCVGPSQVTLTLNLYDSYGDGWNGNVLAFQQNDKVVATFGDNFTTGKSLQNIAITITSGVSTKIVVSRLGRYRQQISFDISFEGKKIFEWKQKSFDKQTVLGIICPNCLQSTKKKAKIKENPVQIVPDVDETEDKREKEQAEEQSRRMALIYQIVIGITGFFLVLALIVLGIICKKWREKIQQITRIHQSSNKNDDKTSMKFQKIQTN